MSVQCRTSDSLLMAPVFSFCFPLSDSECSGINESLESGVGNNSRIASLRFSNSDPKSIYIRYFIWKLTISLVWHYVGPVSGWSDRSENTENHPTLSNHLYFMSHTDNRPNNNNKMTTQAWIIKESPTMRTWMDIS